MIELLFSTVLTCQEANLIAARAILNNNISTTTVAEIIEELRPIAPPECVLPDVQGNS